MKIASLRIITDDVARLVAFYEHVTGLAVAWATPDFAEISTPTFTLAIGSTRTVGVFGPGSARPADNHSLIVEFLTNDVDADYARLREKSRCCGPVRQRTHRNAMEQPVPAAPRPRRHLDQPVHPRDRTGNRKVGHTLNQHPANAAGCSVPATPSGRDERGHSAVRRCGGAFRSCRAAGCRPLVPRTGCDLPREGSGYGDICRCV